jgi:hypothetical protein
LYYKPETKLVDRLHAEATALVNSWETIVSTQVDGD